MDEENTLRDQLEEMTNEELLAIPAPVMYLLRDLAPVLELESKMVGWDRLVRLLVDRHHEALIAERAQKR